ncbi:hypothetical protein B14911_10882 [Bacillus sp. NRRL B-14911]|nr:hypothetical protein B14911_10882 [Bacillus sp. NRRL B-14911]
MYKLLINSTDWKPCPGELEDDILYVARTLSKYGRSRVDVYHFLGTEGTKSCSFMKGQYQKEIKDDRAAATKRRTSICHIFKNMLVSFREYINN